MRLEVENIKCGGCANSIRKGLLDIEGLESVEVDIESGAIEIGTTDDAIRLMVIEKLAAMGYPERGSVHGLQSAGAKARSFVSCAVGRMQS